MSKDLRDVLDWCSDIVEESKLQPEEQTIKDLKEIYEYLYGGNISNYYLISHDGFFELLNRYRERMGLSKNTFEL